MVFRPATGGFLVTLGATACLAIASFSVPFLKSIYFLSTTVNYENIQGVATFGVLGYCMQTGSTQVCSNATVGWEFDPNALLGIDLPLNVDIPTVVVKWITYILVLHMVGLGLAALSAVFGLLAHIREMAMTCFSSCIAGMAAAVTLLAFIFDIIFFILIRTRVRAIGGTANLGNAFWLTLSAWIMLFFSGFCFGIGRCCIASRPRGPKGEQSKKWYNGAGWHQGGNMETAGISHSEAMRMDAIKAEQERKKRQAEVGLPAFPTKADAESLPLNSKRGEAQYYVDEDSEDDTYHKGPYVPAGAARRGSTGTTYTSNLAGRGRQPTSQQVQPQYSGGYMQGAPGTRSIDAYNNNPPPFPSASTGNNLHPSHQYRHGSMHSSTHTPAYNPAGSSSSPPPMPMAQPAYLGPSGVGEVYGHGPRQTSYQTAMSHHPGQASTYSQYDQNQGYTQQSSSYGGNQGQGYGYGSTPQSPTQNTSGVVAPPIPASNPYVDPYSIQQPQPTQPNQSHIQYDDQPYSAQQQQDFYHLSGDARRTPIAHVSPPWNQPGNTLVNSGNVIETTPTPATTVSTGLGMVGMPGRLPSETTPPVPPPKHQTSGGSIPSDAPPGYDGGYGAGPTTSAPGSYPPVKR